MTGTILNYVRCQWCGGNARQPSHACTPAGRALERHVAELFGVEPPAGNKVPLVHDYDPKGFHAPGLGRRPLVVTRALPFYINPRATRVHRVRSATVAGWDTTDPAHARKQGRGSVFTWCGQVGHFKSGAHLSDLVPLDEGVCMLCERKAIRNGNRPSSDLCGREVRIIEPELRYRP